MGGQEELKMRRRKDSWIGTKNVPPKGKEGQKWINLRSEAKKKKEAIEIRGVGEEFCKGEPKIRMS